LTPAMASLIGLFYEAPVMTAAQRSPTPTNETDREALQDSMRRAFDALLRVAAPAYERLPSAARKVFLPAWSALQERMDLAHQEGAWAEFQAALSEAKALLAEAKGAMIGKA